MPVLTNTDLQRFWEQGENEVSTERPFIVDRYSPSVVAGTSTYTLNDYIIDIRRVTWLGQKLDPMTKRNEREVFQAATQTGTPFWYVFNNIGANKISLFPKPEVSVAAGVNLWSTDIATSVIIEYNRATDNSTFVLPGWAKRSLLKNHVAWRAAMVDGASFDKKSINFFKQKWMREKSIFVTILNELHTLPRKFMVQEIVSSNYFPGEPTLPIDSFGISVDEGH